MLSLSGDRGDVSLVGSGFFLSRWSRGDPAGAAVVADPVHCGVVDHRGVVGVVNVGDVHVVHRTVVLELSVVPTAAFIAPTAVAVAIVDSAVETNVLTPIALIESEPAAAPTPIARRPEEPRLRSHDPGTGHPIVIAVGVSPVARGPEITLGGDGWLLIHRQRGRAN